MRRRHTVLLIGLGILAFLVISALLARAFSVGGAEDASLTDLVRAEARGDAAAVSAMLSGCRADPRCRADVSGNVAPLRHAGSVSIVQIQSSAGFSLTGTVGTARVVWLVGSSLPIVQCVRVRRAGDVFQGFTIRLLRLSARIKTDADCPSRF